MESIYTVFFEFQSGIYIDQVCAVDQHEAKLKWAKQLPHNEISGLGAKTKAGLIAAIKCQEPIAPNGVVSIWSTGVVFLGRYGHITIVKTAL